LIISFLFLKNIFLKKTKLFQTLLILSEKELLLFKKWLDSPFHNNNEQVKKLYQIIWKHAPSFESKTLEKSVIYKKIYPKMVYNEFKINNIISLTTRQLFDFLAYHNYKNSSTLSEICLMDELQKRDLDQLMLQEGKRLAKAKTQSIIETASTFFDEYLYYKQLDEHFLKKPKRAYDENLQLKNNNLDLFYLTTKLKVACDMISRNTVIQANYEAYHFQDLEKWLLNADEKVVIDYKKYPAIAVYYQAYRTIKDGKLEDYEVLKDLLATNLHIFPNVELSRIYDYVLNFCIRQINQGKAEFYREILDVYQFLLENRVIFQKDYLAQWDYKNIITVGIRIGETEWTENFINEYKDFLPPKDRENAFVYNKAAFYYATKAYKKSLQLLHEVKFTDTSYHLGAKIIQLKSFYELEEEEPFYALIDAFKIYILRSKDISHYRKQANLNLIKFAKRIFKLKEQHRFISPSIFNQKWESVNDRLSKMENVANKSWLEECLVKIKR
jgi:uncharacterized protein (DUF1778 family)